MRSIVRYSAAFKQRVVSELESGKFLNPSEAMEYYGIGGNSTIQYWLKQFGRNDLLPKTVRVETLGEKDKIKELKKKVRLLEKTLASSRVDQVMAEAYFEVLCEEFGVDDIETLKKKLESKLSSGESS